MPCQLSGLVSFFIGGGRKPYTCCTRLCLCCRGKSGLGEEQGRSRRQSGKAAARLGAGRKSKRWSGQVTGHRRSLIRLEDVFAKLVNSISVGDREPL